MAIGSGPLSSLFFALFTLLFTLHSQSQTLSPKITIFTPDQYKGHYQIFSTEPFPGGRRAFGTASEVLVHDGETFAEVQVGSGKFAISMDQDSVGRLFVGGASLMGVIAPDSTGTLSFSSLRSLLPDSLRAFGNIWDTHYDGEGGVYFNSFDHIFHYAGDTIRVIRPESRFFRMNVPSGRPVVQDSDTGLFALSGAGKEYLPGSDTLAKGKRIRAILPAPGDGSTWAVLTQAHGLYRYDPSTGRTGRFEGDDGGDSRRALREAEVYTAVRLDHEANPYGAAYAVGTSLKGLYLLDPEGVILLHLGRQAGIPAKKIWQVSTDGVGNIWAATNNGIALVHTGLPFTVAEEGGLFSGGVNDISRGITPDREVVPDSAPLFLATSQGTWKWTREEGGFSIVPGSEGQCMDFHSHNIPGGWPRVLIGASELLSISAVAGSPIPADTLSRDNVYTLTDLPTPWKRGVLFGGRDGLRVLVPTKEGPLSWKELFSVEEFPEAIRSVEWVKKEDTPDSLVFWVGTASKGVLRVTTDTAFSYHHLTRYDTANGLPEGTVHVFPEPFGKGKGVFFGTNEGLYAFEDGRFVPDCRYGRIFCDSSRPVSDLKKGTDGEVWINDITGGQVKHLVPKEEGYRIDSTVFRALELGSVRAIFPEEGRAWLGGDRGLVCYFPGFDVDTEREWDCRVSEVRGSGDSLLFGGWFMREGNSRREKGDGKREELFEVLERVPKKEQPAGMVPVLPYSENRMAFTFAAAFPTRQEAVVYSYKLAGFDTSWSKWTKETKKEYTNLDEGDYIFKVKARNIYLEESNIDEYRFTILPPWYRTVWAYSLYGVCGFSIFAMMGWLVKRKRKADHRAKEYLEGLEKANLEIREKNENLKKANETISKQKEEVEEQQKKTQEQKEKVEEAHGELQEAHQEITSSIAYARRIQDALLQSEDHVSPHIHEHFILFKPQSQVSGDFYWAKEHKGYLYFAAVDCTGHGVPGAFMSMLGISQLNEIMNTDQQLTPGTILTRLRERVVQELTGADPKNATKDGMDAALVRIPLGGLVGSRGKEATGSRPVVVEGDEQDGLDPSGLTVQFAGANNPLYVVREGIGVLVSSGDDRGGRESSAHKGPTTDDNGSLPTDDHLFHIQMYQDGQIIPTEEERLKPFKKTEDGLEIKGDKMAVGYEPNAAETFVTTEINLQEGDALYFFSDGYADQFGGPKGKKFRYGPFKQLLVDLHQKPMDEQKKELDRIFEDWKAESAQEQIDDVVVVGVRIPSSSDGWDT